MEFEKENRYVVMKIKDVEKYLSAKDKHSITRIANKLDRERKADGKRELRCVVVEDDWPEHETVWRMIESRMGEARTLKTESSGKYDDPKERCLNCRWYSKKYNSCDHCAFGHPWIDYNGKKAGNIEYCEIFIESDT